MDIHVKSFDDDLGLKTLTINPLTINPLTIADVRKIAPVGVHVKELNHIAPLFVDHVRHIDPLRIDHLNISSCFHPHSGYGTSIIIDFRNLPFKDTASYKNRFFKIIGDKSAQTISWQWRQWCI